MATAAPQSQRHHETAEIIRELKVSRYDQVSSLLIAGLVMVGITAVALFVAWLSSRLVFSVPPVPVKYVEEPYGRGDHAPGFGLEAEAPGEEELPELTEPQVEATLEAMTDAVSSVAASMDVFDTAATATSKGEGGQGDRRPPGPLGMGEDIIPRWERWEIRFESGSVDGYARQLDFFKIELGAIGGSPLVDYAYNLTKPKPDTRTGPGDQEKRLYMTWRTGNLKEFDRQLLSRAGINTRGRILMQFYPEIVEDTLAALEMDNAKGKSPKEFLKTVFGVRTTRGRSEFYVLEQRFRPAPR